jgi:hypothetical protein
MRAFVITLFSLFSTSLFAAMDTGAIDTAKTDMLAAVAAMLALAVAVWGGKKVVGLFGK